MESKSKIFFGLATRDFGIFEIQIFNRPCEGLSIMFVGNLDAIGGLVVCF